MLAALSTSTGDDFLRALRTYACRARLFLSRMRQYGSHVALTAK